MRETGDVLYESGHVVDVTVVTLGDELDGDHASGATTLTVGDCVDFDAGGMVLIDGTTYDVTGVDDDANTITIDPGLVDAMDDGESVEVWDPLYQVVSSYKSVQVRVLSEDSNEDVVDAVLMNHLVDELEEGIRGAHGESVRLQLDGDEWLVIDVLGLGIPDDKAGLQFKKDSFTITAVGDQEFVLSRTPLPESDHLYWNGQEQEGEYSLTGNVVTMDDPAALMELGDTVDVKYAYRHGFGNPNDIPFGAHGWKILQVAEADSTDRSGTSFNDNGFTRATFPVGDSTPAHPEDEWGDPATIDWDIHTALWVRRTVLGRAGVGKTITIRVDDYLDGVWWNGVLVHGPEANTTPYGERVVTIDGADVDGHNLLALKCRDSPTGGGVGVDRTYIDIQVLED